MQDSLRCKKIIMYIVYNYIRYSDDKISLVFPLIYQTSFEKKV